MDWQLGVSILPKACRLEQMGTESPAVLLLGYLLFRLLKIGEYGHYFCFIAQKYKSVQVKCKLCPGQKQLHHTAKTTSSHCEHQHIQHAHTN